MTVTKYVAKFTELAQFAPAIVPTNDARKRKFMLRLRVEVAKQIESGSHGPNSYLMLFSEPQRMKVGIGSSLE